MNQVPTPTTQAPGLTRFTLRFKHSLSALLGDLSLLAALYLARFIVWRTLRARRHRQNYE